MSWKGCVKIIRPANCAMMGLAVVVGGFMASGKAAPNPKLLLGFATGFALAAVVNVHNDLVDLELDRINRPDRPLPSGELGKESAAALASALLIAGLAAAALTSPACAALALASTLLGALYNSALKRTGLPGNVVVASIVSVPFAYGWLAVGGPGSPLLFLFTSTAFCAILGREIAKGMADVEGDAQKGVRTVAVSRGMRAAAASASALFLSSILLSLVPLAMKIASPLYLAFLLPTVAGFLFSASKILKDPTPRTAYVEKRRVLAWMALGLLAFLAGGAA
ncbi:MAG: geranylgeranylglycerol-phosphate geranylgeranyltransferase [Candidatus Brockarchaeota archaeon]|nr:geranylgeranylglycerol-phosphate geranylgeranyltransferase [Candidatus Brockarchaeota archaeon]